MNEIFVVSIKPNFVQLKPKYFVTQITVIQVIGNDTFRCYFMECRKKKYPHDTILSCIPIWIEGVQLQLLQKLFKVHKVSHCSVAGMKITFLILTFLTIYTTQKFSLKQKLCKCLRVSVYMNGNSHPEIIIIINHTISIFLQHPVFNPHIYVYTDTQT